MSLVVGVIKSLFFSCHRRSLLVPGNSSNNVRLDRRYGFKHKRIC